MASGEEWPEWRWRRYLFMVRRQSIIDVGHGGGETIMSLFYGA